MKYAYNDSGGLKKNTQSSHEAIAAGGAFARNALNVTTSSLLATAGGALA